MFVFFNLAEKGGGDNDGDRVAGGGAVDYTSLVTRFEAGGRGRWRKRRAGKRMTEGQQVVQTLVDSMCFSADSPLV